VDDLPKCSCPGAGRLLVVSRLLGFNMFVFFTSSFEACENFGLFFSPNYLAAKSNELA
jgi:hypothetical protein